MNAQEELRAAMAEQKAANAAKKAARDAKILRGHALGMTVGVISKSVPSNNANVVKVLEAHGKTPLWDRAIKGRWTR